MTSEGIRRIAELFSKDISKISYTVNDVLTEKDVTDISIKEDRVVVYAVVKSSEKGTISNFKLIGNTGIVLTEKSLSFTKGEDEIMVDFPFLFISEVE